jgi:hypothetical protein
MINDVTIDGIEVYLGKTQSVVTLRGELHIALKEFKVENIKPMSLGT